MIISTAIIETAVEIIIISTVIMTIPTGKGVISVETVENAVVKTPVSVENATIS